MDIKLRNVVYRISDAINELQNFFAGSHNNWEHLEQCQLVQNLRLKDITVLLYASTRLLKLLKVKKECYKIYKRHYSYSYLARK
jgi:hypothetical protein